MLISGTSLAAKLDLQLRAKIDKLSLKPRLAIVQIGDNPESDSYVGAKKRGAEKLGIKVHHVQIKKHISTLELISKVQELGKDKNIHGIIVQLPLPTILDTKRIITAVPANKDVDGFNHESPFTPPVALGVLEIIKATEKNLHSKNIVVLGRGITGGDTVIRTLDKLNIPHVVIHSKTHNPDEILKKADIIISAVGKPEIIKAKVLKPGVKLISIGITKTKNGLVGDYNEEEIKDIASFYTPTPGGIGPLTVHFLMENVYEAAKN